MDYELMFPGRFLKGADLQGKDVTLTIKGVKLEKMEQGKEKETKGIVSFQETERELALNRTNAEAMKLIWGRETSAWVGHKVTLYPLKMKDPFSDADEPEEIICVRVRGSPDLTAPKSATVPRGRKVLKITVRPTGQSNGKAAAVTANGKGPAAGSPSPAASAPVAQPPPAVDPRTLPISHPDAEPPEELGLPVEPGAAG